MLSGSVKTSLLRPIHIRISMYPKEEPVKTKFSVIADGKIWFDERRPNTRLIMSKNKSLRGTRILFSHDSYTLYIYNILYSLQFKSDDELLRK